MLRGSLLILLFLGCVAMAAPAQLGPMLPEAPPAVARNTPGEPLRNPLEPYDSAALKASMAAPEFAAVVAVAAPEARPKVWDKKFIALGAVVFALTAADVELTQHCLQAKTCYEMNPTLPDSRWGQYAVNTVTNLGVMYFSYWRRKAGKWGWWIAPVADMGAHGAGIGSNIRFAH
jgi:hypothetical protein